MVQVREEILFLSQCFWFIITTYPESGLRWSPQQEQSLFGGLRQVGGSAALGSWDPGLSSGGRGLPPQALRGGAGPAWLIRRARQGLSLLRDWP